MVLGANSGVFAGAWISFEKTMIHYNTMGITQDYPGLRTTHGYPGLPRTTQELVRPVVLSITDSCAKHYSSKWWFGPVMISILPRDYPGTTQESQTSCAKQYRAVMLIITGSNHHF